MDAVQSSRRDGPPGVSGTVETISLAILDYCDIGVTDFSVSGLRSAAEISCPKPIFRELKTGWFSDRSACYLAAGRPVITQETGFSNILPTGRGLLPLLTGLGGWHFPTRGWHLFAGCLQSVWQRLEPSGCCYMLYSCLVAGRARPVIAQCFVAHQRSSSRTNFRHAIGSSVAFWRA
jgi:hypothetical protein